MESAKLFAEECSFIIINLNCFLKTIETIEQLEKNSLNDEIKNIIKKIDFSKINKFKKNAIKLINIFKEFPEKVAKLKDKHCVVKFLKNNEFYFDDASNLLEDCYQEVFKSDENFDKICNYFAQKKIKE